ncbi:MAG: hypothetical protein WCP52_04780 [Bacteroidota bacterium]
MSRKKIGFVSLYETEVRDSYVGTVLITDHYGIPLEFKCTHSVKATAIQKALYGERLEPYIGIELCGVPLLKSITNTPDFLFINIPYLVGIRKKIDLPTILISRAEKNKDTESSANTGDEKILIVNEYDTYEPIEIEYHPDFAKHDSNLTLEEIQLVFANFDLFEPFDRMRKSVEILGKSDSKFK